MKQYVVPAALVGAAGVLASGVLDTHTGVRGQMGGRESLEEFVRRNGITATAKRVARNPSMDDEADQLFVRTASHWSVTLRKAGGGKFTVPFSMGSAHTSPPDADDVLDNVAADAAGLENARDFRDWAGEYGYDEDSRRALRTYRAVQRNSAKLKAFLGSGQYEQLLWNVERL